MRVRVVRAVTLVAAIPDLDVPELRVNGVLSQLDEQGIDESSSYDHGRHAKGDGGK
jgi:hypothetical protein